MSPKFPQTTEVIGYLPPCAAQELLNGLLWGWRLPMLYQLHRLLRDTPANSHPPGLSPGRGEGAASSHGAQGEAVWL